MRCFPTEQFTAIGLSALLLAACTSSEPQAPAAGTAAPLAASSQVAVLPPPAMPAQTMFTTTRPAPPLGNSFTQPGSLTPNAAAPYPVASQAAGNCHTTGNVTTCDAPPNPDDTLYTN